MCIRAIFVAYKTCRLKIQFLVVKIKYWIGLEIDFCVYTRNDYGLSMRVSVSTSKNTETALYRAYSSLFTITGSAQQQKKKNNTSETRNNNLTKYK